jgi:DNA-directed RNA polymerase specialized sigma24 family protein
MGKSVIVEQLRAVASKLTGDIELQKDLLQEMFVHMVGMQTNRPGMETSWYIKSCEFHARNYLKQGRSIDSLKRSKNSISLDRPFRGTAGESDPTVHPTDPCDWRAELISKEIVDLITPYLSERQQQILFLLTKGLGVREIGRELGITHPAVIKHRKKIAAVARALLNNRSAGDPNGSSGSTPVKGFSQGNGQS